MSHAPVKILADTHDATLDLAVNGQAWLGQLGELRTAVLSGDQRLARRLARQPIRFRPWRQILQHKQQPEEQSDVRNA